MENSPLTDDVALLREALAFIGVLDGDDASLSPPSVDGDDDASDGFLWSLLAGPEESESVETTPYSPVAPVATPEATTGIKPEQLTPPRLAWPSATSTTKSIAKPPRKNKRRQEIMYLREMVGELESKLTQVKQQTHEQKLREVNDPSGEQAASQIVLSAAWAEVATHQSEQRERAEMENIKLKRLLEDQIQVGKSLERLLLRKRPKLEETEPVEKRARHGKLPSSSPWDSDQIFEEIMASIDGQYQDTARVLTKVQSLVQDVSSTRKVELVRDEELGMVLLTAETHILPFEYELAAQEYWQSIPEISNHGITRSNDVDFSDNLIKATFSVSASFGRVHGDITMYIVNHRFCEPHRTVFVSSALVDPSKVSDMNMDGVYMRHRGWVVLEPTLTESGKAVTQMTSYAVSVPKVFEELEDQTHKVGALTNFVMTALSIELESRQQAFENRLFDRSLGAVK